MKTSEVGSGLVRHVTMRRVFGHESQPDLDAVAVEEPLEIRLQYWFKGKQQTESLALTMRTPGHDRELALGFLFSEGVIGDRHDVSEVRPLGGSDSNELLVSVNSNVDIETWRMSRSTFVNSSCGVCGKRSIAALAVQTKARAYCDDAFFPASLLFGLPEVLHESQAGFAQTGGLHAAARVDAKGRIVAMFEDVGRHNALDKLLGDALLSGYLPLSQEILFLSSRASFELVQKAVAANAPVLATVGSASSLAIESARHFGLTLAGFVRDRRFNLYSGEWRIKS